MAGLGGVRPGGARLGQAWQGEAGMAKRVCSVDGCPTITDGGRCTDHTRAADRARGTSKDRGYSTPGHRRFRRLVLKRDPLCVLCGQVATVADHWPVSRRDLEANGANPNDPNAGRGLCATCHNRSTARAQPGGWNDDGWRVGG